MRVNLLEGRVYVNFLTPKVSLIWLAPSKVQRACRRRFASLNQSKPKVNITSGKMRETGQKGRYDGDILCIYIYIYL